MQAVICASTGNTAASAAAYAARAGLPAVVLQPAGAVALGKLAQARALGARVLEVRGSFDEALAAARELGGARHARARELAQPAPAAGAEDGGVRDRRGARRRRRTCSRCRTAAAATRRRTGSGSCESGQVPRFLAVEAAERATTEASAIRITDPVHVDEVGAALAPSRRRGRHRRRRRDPRRVAHARARGGRLLRARVGGRAGRRDRTRLEPGSRVVCVITGNGLKDPEIAARLSPEPVPVDADPDAIAAAA